MSTEMYVYIACIVFVYGLLTGSFLNLCIYRLPKGQSINSPKSCCEVCGTSLKLYDIIPVISYIISHGKCRYCKAKISIFHPLFELFVGIVFLGVYLVTGISFKFIIYLIFASVLILVFFIDLKHYIIPNYLVVIGFIAGTCITIYNAATGAAWIDNLVGCLVGFGIFLLGDLISMLAFKKYGMGGGDIKLMAVIGLFMGIRSTISIMFISAVLAAITSIALILVKKLKRQDSIPYGPFMVLGTIVVTILYI